MCHPLSARINSCETATALTAHTKHAHFDSNYVVAYIDATTLLLGIEPRAFRLTVERSNQLSYKSKYPMSDSN